MEFLSSNSLDINHFISSISVILNYSSLFGSFLTLLVITKIQINSFLAFFSNILFCNICTGLFKIIKNNCSVQDFFNEDSDSSIENYFRLCSLITDTLISILIYRCVVHSSQKRSFLIWEILIAHFITLIITQIGSIIGISLIMSTNIYIVCQNINLLLICIYYYKAIKILEARNMSMLIPRPTNYYNLLLIPLTMAISMGFQLISHLSKLFEYQGMVSIDVFTSALINADGLLHIGFYGWKYLKDFFITFHKNIVGYDSITITAINTIESL